MHIEFLVEEPSMKAALTHLLPQIFASNVTFKIHPFQGKLDLIKKLPQRLNGYRFWLPDDWKIVILIDEDRQECEQLKMDLENIAQKAGLITKTSVSKNQFFQLINRIVVEELESWFFGDVEAICKAYPRVKGSLAEQKRYRDPDAILGGTWEALERELKKAGYHQGGLEKYKASADIAKYMIPQVNRSKSFQVFYHTLLQLTQNNQ
ncbi:hypothetical protein B9S53_18345 [Arthrospira sp. O9.13F]|nr:hypothetical protein B9S53_18345 [Arthrospira sp. O9.13F]